MEPNVYDQLDKAKAIIAILYPYLKQHYERSIYGKWQQKLLFEMREFLIENNVEFEE